MSRLLAKNDRHIEERWVERNFQLKFSNLISLINSGVQEDPVIHSMGLKMECNTRRFVIPDNDRRELQYRVEVQNRVYRKEMANLDAEIAKLEKMLENRSSSTSSSQVSVLPQIKVNPCKTKFNFEVSCFAFSFTARDNYWRWRVGAQNKVKQTKHLGYPPIAAVVSFAARHSKSFMA